VAATPKQPVPWRTIWAAIASVAVVYLSYQAVVAVGRILTYLAAALFFAVVLTPPVDFLQHRTHLRRGLATLVVVVVGLGVLAGMVFILVRPLVTQASTFSKDLPQYIEDARNGKGPVGDLVKRYDLEQKVKDNQDKIEQTVSDFGKSSLDIVRKIFSTIIAIITVMVLTILILIEGPQLSQSVLRLIPDDVRRDRVQRVGVDATRAVSGYVFGNLLISVIAGAAAWLMLAILGVPYAEVLGLFVGLADLIPLVGATLGAVPCIGFAFLHSVPAGIITLIFFIVYQQFENHVLQVSIMARTVKLNPLAVLVSVLIGVELYGFLGALLAIPVAGVIQVVARDIYDENLGRFKPEPTIGADEVPLVEVEVDGHSS
jgi:predicted PurR-regulated permease PerM